jgi:uncharacterized coiled-coil protein SlyX
MAIPWLAVLQSVPWTDVIRNAPKVADGAKKLWDTIGKESPEPQSAMPPDNQTLSADARIAALEERLAATESAIAELHDKLLASSELIKALAEQNTQLVKHIETNRQRVLWLTAAVTILGITALSALALVLTR